MYSRPFDITGDSFEHGHVNVMFAKATRLLGIFFLETRLSVSECASLFADVEQACGMKHVV